MTLALDVPNACALAPQTFWRWFLGTAARQLKLLPLPELKIVSAANVVKRLALQISSVFGCIWVQKPLGVWV
jgi:hypothetical protein